ncbi:oxidoreductase [Histoplasma capsulatum H143]|uniref:Oxidoreductase n=1 Tax=Ajellomyces capsulatus (strain H143) TaxID=544712 RepID=C6H618_AJECH|nr:oxidoreductase [Histoplasma capsulatum H143]
MTSTRKLLSENTWTRYGCSKAGNVVLAAQLARLYPQITSVSLHPGLIMTNLYSATKSSNPLVKYATALASPLLVNEEEGALNHLWATGVEKEMLVNGAYYEPVGVWARNWFAEDETLGEELWRYAEREIHHLMFPSMVKHGLSVIGLTMLTFAGHDIIIPTGEARDKQR